MNTLFENYGFLSSGIFNVTPREAFELCGKGAVIVDVREDYLNSFKIFDVPAIIFLPRSTLEENYSSLPGDKYMILADSVGIRSKEVFVFLKDKGYDKIANMAGGIVDWEQEALPLKTNDEQKLTGSCLCQLKARGKNKHA
jgi:sulfur dioxygenase